MLERPENLGVRRVGLPKLLDRLKQVPDLTNVASDLRQQGLTVNLVIDRETAARFGITPATVDNALYDLFGQRIISTIYSQSNQYRVIMEADPSLQGSLDSLSAIRLPSAASLNRSTLTLNRSDRAKAGTVADQSIFGRFPGDHDFIRYRRGFVAGGGGDAIRQAEQDIHLPEEFA